MSGTSQFIKLEICSNFKSKQPYQVAGSSTHSIWEKKKEKTSQAEEEDVCVPLEAACVCKPDTLAYRFATVTDNRLTKFRILIWGRILYEGNVSVSRSLFIPPNDCGF